MKQTNKVHGQNTLQQNLFDTDSLEKNSKLKQKPEKNYVFDILDALNAPVLTFSQQWADMIPKRIIDLVPMARMIALMRQERTATYAECVIYIYTRALEAPMDYEWTDIYTHVGCKTLEDWFGENHWQATGAPAKLSEWLLSKLDGLRRDIYNKRRDILKSRIKQEEQVEVKEGESPKEIKKNNSIEQGTFLF